MQIRDCDNTITDFKPFFGKNYDEVKDLIDNLKGKKPEKIGKNGIGYKVKYCNERKIYSVDECYYMLLKKCKDIIEYNNLHLSYFNQYEKVKELKNCVLSVYLIKN